MGDCCGLDGIGGGYVVASRDKEEPGLRYLLAIANRCRIIVGLGSICAVSGKGTATKQPREGYQLRTV